MDRGPPNVAPSWKSTMKNGNRDDALLTDNTKQDYSVGTRVQIVHGESIGFEGVVVKVNRTKLTVKKTPASISWKSPRFNQCKILPPRPMPSGMRKVIEREEMAEMLEEDRNDDASYQQQEHTNKKATQLVHRREQQVDVMMDVLAQLMKGMRTADIETACDDLCNRAKRANWQP